MLRHDIARVRQRLSHQARRDGHGQPHLLGRADEHVDHQHRLRERRL
jgi:hypothetical protein